MIVSQLSESAGLESFPHLHYRQVVTILFDYEETHPCTVAGSDHVIGIPQTQGHRFFDNHMSAEILGHGDRLLGVITARSEYTRHIDFHRGEHFIYVAC